MAWVGHSGARSNLVQKSYNQELGAGHPPEQQRLWARKQWGRGCTLNREPLPGIMVSPHPGPLPWSVPRVRCPARPLRRSSLPASKLTTSFPPGINSCMVRGPFLLSSSFALGDISSLTSWTDHLFTFQESKCSIFQLWYISWLFMWFSNFSYKWPTLIFLFCWTEIQSLAHHS